MGIIEGSLLGFDDSLGWPDGASVTSTDVGLLLTDGNALGSDDGSTEGEALGSIDGSTDGEALGMLDGTELGPSEGD